MMAKAAPLVMDLFEEEIETDPAAIADAAPETRRVLNVADRLGVPYTYRRLSSSELGLAEMAAECGCPIDYIVKSIVFKGKASKKPVLMLVSAKSKVNEKALSALVGEVLEKGPAEFVKRHTSFELGSVPPMGITGRMTVLIDEHLMHFARVWCSAGTPDSMILVPTMVLARAISARIVRPD